MVRGWGKLRQSGPKTHTGYSVLIYFVKLTPPSSAIAGFAVIAAAPRASIEA